MELAVDNATKKKLPRKKSKLRVMGSGGPKGTIGRVTANINSTKFNNPPPRRIRAEDTRDLFPMIGIENDEQRRLAKIANSIGGMAS